MSSDPTGAARIHRIEPLQSAVSAAAQFILRRGSQPGDRAPTHAEQADELDLSVPGVQRVLGALRAAGVVFERRVGGSTTAALEPGCDRAAARVDSGRTGPTTERRRAGCAGGDRRLVGPRGCRRPRWSCSGSAQEDRLADERARSRTGRIRHPGLRLPPRIGARHRRPGGVIGLSVPIRNEMHGAFLRSTNWSSTARRLADDHDQMLPLVRSGDGPRPVPSPAPPPPARLLQPTPEAGVEFTGGGMSCVH